MSEDNLDQKLDGGTLPGAFKSRWEGQVPARSDPNQEDGTLPANRINSQRIGIFDLERLAEIEAGAITEILVEETEDLVHKTGALPAVQRQHLLKHWLPKLLYRPNRCQHSAN